MKWLAIVFGGVAGLALLAVVVLLALSFRPGAGRITGTVVVDRPPSEVWPWIVEADRLLEWVGWLVEVEVLTPGVEGVGSRVRWVMIDPTLNNRRVEIEGEVMEWEPGRLSTMSLDSPGMFTGEGRYELVEVEGGRTRVEYESRFRMGAPVGRLLEPVVTPQAARKAADDLARLKERIEAGSESE